MERLIWLNDKIVPLGDATISVLSPTSQFGANVFEGIRCYWNDLEEELYAFRLRDHYIRLFDSARLFRINCPYTMEELESNMKDTIKANNFHEDIAVRQTLFVSGYGSWFSQEPVGMFIAPIAKKRKEHPLCGGETTCISSWERISDRIMSPRAKVGANYINSRLAKLEANDNGYDSALFLNSNGYVAEGTGSCFFMVKGKHLITPKLTDSILNSITRDTVIRLAEEIMDLQVEERQINRTELYLADEAFFCGSAAEITPIIKLDSYKIGDGIPGKITQAVHKNYLDIVSGANKKYRDWLTPIYEE